MNNEKNGAIKSLQTGFGPDVLSLAQLVEFPTEKKKRDRFGEKEIQCTKT